MKNILFPAVLIIAISCSAPTAQQVVDKAIASSGVDKLQNATAFFSFRSIDYEYFAENGRYSYARTQTDSLGNKVKDILTNQGLKRFINNTEVELSEEKQAAYTSSVNSVIYFAFLPYRLNDQAVNKTFEGTTKIDGKSYYKVKVTFDSEGGGEDFEDVFYYWFDTQDYSMDYLTYSYNEEDEGKGIRFRVAYNSRKINGVTIQDYRNLKPKEKGAVPLDQIDQAYQEGKLEELSLIELEDMKVH